MFLSFFIPVGVFLLMASRRPSEHRSMIALAAWWNISHGGVMAIQTVEAWAHGVHRNFSDVILFLVIGVVLLALLPAKREAVTPEVAVAKRRNRTLCADNRFFSCCFNGFFFTGL